MAEAVVARWRGDLYQSRLFWREACKLFHDDTNVIEVRYEDVTPKGFDDVVVRYDPPVVGEDGSEIRTDCFQVKFHEDYRSEVTWRALIDPAFVNRKDQSLLGSLRAAYGASDGAGALSRFTAITPWRIASGDQLGQLVGTDGGTLSIDRLKKGVTPRSALGMVRTAWREHLGLGSDDELFDILRRFRLQTNALDIVTTLEELNRDLRNAGLAPVQARGVIVPYDDLLPKLRSGGILSFTRASLQSILDREGLWKGGPVVTSHRRSVGVKSFTRSADAQTGEVEEVLDLTAHFSGRRPQETDGWQTSILPEVVHLAESLASDRRACALHLAAHASIAFALGYHLDAKVGVDAAIAQPSTAGTALWDLAAPPEAPPHWEFEEILPSEGGPDVAIAVGITHDIRADVAAFTRAGVPSVGRVLSATIRPYPASRALRGGSHALGAAQELVAHLRAGRSQAERTARLHVFLAAPNGFTFFLGQHARALGQIQLYEHDLEAGGASYSPSISLPKQPLPSSTHYPRR